MNNKLSKKRVFWSIKMAIIFIVLLELIVVGVKIFLALKSGVAISAVLLPPDFSIRNILQTIAEFIVIAVSMYIFFYPNQKEE